MKTRIALAVAAAFTLGTQLAEGRVTRIVVDQTETPLCLARNAAGVCASSDPAYESVTGRAFSELDPADPKNALITDIESARAAGPVRVSIWLSYARWARRRPSRDVPAERSPPRGGETGPSLWQCTCRRLSACCRDGYG